MSLGRAALFLMLLAGAASALAAHDFWLVPDAFGLTPGGRIAVSAQTSSLFPTSLSAVSEDRIVSATVVTADTIVVIRGASVAGTSLRLVHPATRQGQHLIGVQLSPRTVRESPASFRRYLDLEGAPEARERYERAGLLPPNGGDSLTRRYAKYAKTVVEVGRGPRAFARVMGHPLEFVPLNDPSALRRGDTLRLRLLMSGQPVPLAKMHAGFADAASRLRDTAAARRASRRDLTLHTDSSGNVALVATSDGVWNIRTLQIVPAPSGSGADWDVHWATFVFAVRMR